MLGNHPDMFGLAETNLLAAETLGELARFHRIRGRMRHGLLRSVAEIGFGEQSEETVAAADAWLTDNPELSTIEMFQVLGEWVGARTLIEKSPSHVYTRGTMKRMQRGFPDAFYLHLTRHPVSTWLSNKEIRDKIFESKKKLGNFTELSKDVIQDGSDLDPDSLWLRPHLSILEFLESVPDDNQLRIRGEDFLERPKLYLRLICEWLDKRCDDDALDAMLHPERSPFAMYGPANARFGNDPKFMESPQLRPYKDKRLPLESVIVSGKTVKFSDAIIEYAKLFGY